MVVRPYSLVNSPETSPHEFYFITVPEGPLTPWLAARVAGITRFIRGGTC
jgi:ferredoxin-NADP reductase